MARWRAVGGWGRIMRGLVFDSLADMRFGLLVLTLAALLAGCADNAPAPIATTTVEPAFGGSAPHQTLGAGASDRFAQQRALWAQPVLFDTDKTTIRADARPIVTRVAALLAASPGTRVIIEGYADERGTREYNLALGARRATAYRLALIAAGVPTGQITDTVSYGKERPAVAGSTEAAWAQNRRALVSLQE